MKKLVLAAMLLVTPALSAQTDKPLPSDTQIKLLKAQRQIQQVQLKIADLQRQFDEANRNIQQLTAEMETECAAAAKAANVDLSKFSCDLDKLAFVPKPATPGAPTPLPPAVDKR